MKKNIFKVILLLLVIFSYSSVYAETNNNHIYFVENLKFEGEKINIKGYAFVSHMDNYGVKDGKGNLTNYLVAYTGNNISLDSSGKCTPDGGKCVVIPLTNESNDYNIDLFWSRCTKGDGDAGFCTWSNHDRYEKVEKGELNFNNDFASSCNGDCMYYNVGFNTNIILKKLVTDLNNGSEKLYSEIKFRIYSKIVDGGVSKIYYSKFGVSEFACRIGERSCVNDTEFSIADGLYKMKISGASNIIEMDAVDAAAQVISNGNLKKYTIGESPNKKDYRFYYNGYVLSDNNSKKYSYKILDRLYSGREIYDGYAEDWFYKLDVFLTNNYYSSSEKGFLVVPNYDGVRNEYSGRNNTNILAFANWGQIASEFKITSFEPNYKKLDCSDIKDNKDEYDSVSTTCDDDASPNGKFQQCKRENSIESTIYIKLDSKPTCGSNYREQKGITNSGTEIIKYYLPVTVKSAVLLEQIGTFHFANFSPQLVYAGKGFSIDNNVANGISYNNTFRWLFGNVITETNDDNYKGTPYIDYSGALYKEVNGSCVEDVNYNINEVLSNAFADDGTNGDKIFYEKDGKLVGASNTLNAVVYAIDEVLKSRYNTSKFDDVQFESCDSNSKSSTCDDKIVSGVWFESKDVNPWSFVFGDEAFDDIYAHRGFGIKRETKLAYQLPYAYVVLSDTIINSKKYKNGDKIYSINKLSDADIATYNLEYVGNQYFVGFKYVYDKANEYDFPFNIVNKDISLVKGMTWNLSGTCGVEVKNRFYKKIIPQCSKKDCGVEAKISYKFRPVSLSNPFPKSVAINWKKWIETNPEATRIKDTKDYGVKYSIRLSKFDIDDAVMLSNINSYSSKHGSYDELNGYEVDGSGAFINKSNDISFSIKQGTTSYCGLGYFSSNCDQYANIMG